MPETKTVGGHRPNLPVIEEEPSEKANTSTPSGSVKTRLDMVVEEEAALGRLSSNSTNPFVKIADWFITKDLTWFIY